MHNLKDRIQLRETKEFISINIISKNNKDEINSLNNMQNLFLV